MEERDSLAKDSPRRPRDNKSESSQQENPDLSISSPHKKTEIIDSSVRPFLLAALTPPAKTSKHQQQASPASEGDSLIDFVEHLTEAPGGTGAGTPVSPDSEPAEQAVRSLDDSPVQRGRPTESDVVDNSRDPPRAEEDKLVDESQISPIKPASPEPEPLKLPIQRRRSEIVSSLQRRSSTSTKKGAEGCHKSSSCNNLLLTTPLRTTATSATRSLPTPATDDDSELRDHKKQESGRNVIHHLIASCGTLKTSSAPAPSSKVGSDHDVTHVPGGVPPLSQHSNPAAAPSRTAAGTALASLSQKQACPPNSAPLNAAAFFPLSGREQYIKEREQQARRAKKLDFWAYSGSSDESTSFLSNSSGEELNHIGCPISPMPSAQEVLMMWSG